MASELKWVESAGGPLVMMPLSRAPSWKGVEGNDYDDACQIRDYTGVIARAWGSVLVLNDEPFPTAVITRQDGMAIIRWMYAPAEQELVELAHACALEGRQPVERLAVEIFDELYAIFDSGASGSSASRLEVELPRGRRELVTYVIKDEAGQVGFLLHRFV